MSLNDLTKAFEKRRIQLIKTLQKAGTHKLDLGKQHQLYGAIKEIENFLKTLYYFRQKEIDSKDTFVLKGKRRKGLFNKKEKK